MPVKPYHETKKPAQRIYVLHVHMHDDKTRQPDVKLEEAIHLAQALNVTVVASEFFMLKKIQARALIGGGKIEELAEKMTALEIDALIVNHGLSPSQQRNLEVALDVKVIDRTHLILEIFADRARTRSGRLQVELAHQMYQQGRLVRAWTHLERQRGGMSKTGGPGERQIELDRRMIRERIQYIKRELKDVEKTRDLQRKSRQKQGLPVVSLVGYTNAGKSTLFNALVRHTTSATQDDAFVKDMLFATLDPLMRKITLPSGKECLLSDTVGFVSDLPHELVEAFASTLEEVTLSDVILHVHDASSSDNTAQCADVHEVLTSIKALDIPRIDVANKMDMMVQGAPEFLSQALPTSALEAHGLDDLLQEIDVYLGQGEETVELHVCAADGKKIAWLHAHTQVLSQELTDDMWHFTVRVATKDKFHVL